VPLIWAFNFNRAVTDFWKTENHGLSLSEWRLSEAVVGTVVASCCRVRRTSNYGDRRFA